MKIIFAVAIVDDSVKIEKKQDLVANVVYGSGEDELIVNCNIIEDVEEAKKALNDLIAEAEKMYNK